MVGHCRDALQWGTARILCGWALQGYLVVGHCRDTLRLGTSVRHYRDTHWLGTARILGGWGGYVVVGDCRDTLRFGAARVFGGWAPQGYLVVGH